MYEFKEILRVIINNVKMMSFTSQASLLNKQKFHLMAKNHLISYFKDTF